VTRFLAYDRILRSALDLPGALCLPAERTAADLHIQLDPPAMRHAGAPLYRRDHDMLVFSPPGVGTYRIAGTRIVVTPAGEANATGLLIATALPAWLWLGGRLVVHAAAVVLPGATRALVIGGATGSGKSTVLAALLARGAAMVGDDTLAVDFAGGVPWSSGLAGGYFRRATAGDARLFQPVPAERTVRRVPIGAIVLLDRRDGTSSFERLTPLAALPELLASRHRPAVPHLLGRDAAVLAQCAALARAVPIHRWRRADGAVTPSDADHGALRAMTRD
jgi:hypothetical protein